MKTKNIVILSIISVIILFLILTVGVGTITVMIKEGGAEIVENNRSLDDQSYPGYDWLRWRGPEGDGISPETGWSDDPEKISVIWQINVGKGYSAPSVLGDKVYVSGNIKKKDIIYCLDYNTGKEIWRFSYDCPAGNYAGPRATPLIHEGRVYSISRKGDLYCLNAESGEVVWQVNIVDKYNISILDWGIASSVIPYDDYVLVNAGKAGLAFESATGVLKWFNGEGPGGYSSPVIFDYNNRKNIAFYNNDNLTVTDTGGKVLRSFPFEVMKQVNAADPLIFDNFAFISAFYGKGCALVDFSANPPVEVWKNGNISSHFSSFYYRDGGIYGFNASPAMGFDGEFRCLSAETGEILWGEKLGFGSFITAGDRFILLLQSGTIKIAEVNKKQYKEISSFKVKRGNYWAAPVLSRGILFVRDNRGALTALSLRG